MVVCCFVVPSSHSLLDAKINSVLSLCHDQAILNAVHSIIQNMIACEDASQQQLSYLQSKWGCGRIEQKKCAEADGKMERWRWKRDREREKAIERTWTEKNLTDAWLGVLLLSFGFACSFRFPCHRCWLAFSCFVRETYVCMSFAWVCHSVDNNIVNHLLHVNNNCKFSYKWQPNSLEFAFFKVISWSWVSVTFKRSRIRRLQLV